MSERGSESIKHDSGQRLSGGASDERMGATRPIATKSPTAAVRNEQPEIEGVLRGGVDVDTGPHEFTPPDYRVAKDHEGS